MSTNIGLKFTNFNRAVNTSTLQNIYQPVTAKEDIDTVEDFQGFLESDSLSNRVLKIIQSLDTHGSTESLEADANPLDNIIKAEVLELLNYRKVSKSKINLALTDLTDGLEPNLRFNTEESLILLNQARSLELITEQQYQDQLGTPSALYNNFPEEYTDVLMFQTNLPGSVPTLDELKLAGLVDFILDTVRTNPEVITNESLIQEYVEKHIDEILLKTEFIGYNKASEILAFPDNILNVISLETFNSLAVRVAPYLQFINDEKLDTVKEFLPSQYIDILDVFSREQIRLMIDKELDIKNLILKTLSLTEVQRVFNELAATFKTEFTESFTQEKLIELITITLNTIYPPKTQLEVYEEISTNLNVPIPEEKITLLENYLKIH